MGEAGVEGLPPMTRAQQLASGRADESSRLDSLFETTFLKYYGRILGILLRLLGDRGRAEELASEVFLKLYRQPWFARSDGNVAGWLYRASTNLGVDALRALARRRYYEEAAGRASLLTARSTNPLDDVLREERRLRVRGVLATLKPSHAQILILRASDLSYRELADAMGVQRASVGTMLIRAEAEFQKRFLELSGKEKKS